MEMKLLSETVLVSDALAMFGIQMLHLLNSAQWHEMTCNCAKCKKVEGW